MQITLNEQESREWLEWKKQPTVTTFPVWRTVEIGTLKTAEEARKAPKDADCKVSRWADELLTKVEFAQEPQTLDLALVSVADLGFTNGATRKEIFDEAKKRGLDLCPAEVGSVLRLQYKDQPMNEWLWTAMEPIVDSDGSPNVFTVARDVDGAWLSACSGHLNSGWSPGVRFVFVRSKR